MDEPWTYEIRVQGLLEAGWSEWFEGITITHERAAAGATLTVLTGVVADQAALQGLLAKIFNLNLILVSLKGGKS